MGNLKVHQLKTKEASSASSIYFLKTRNDEIYNASIWLDRYLCSSSNSIIIIIYDE